jgi:hypothetical protein
MRIEWNLPIGHRANRERQSAAVMVNAQADARCELHAKNAEPGSAPATINPQGLSLPPVGRL